MVFADSRPIFHQRRDLALHGGDDGDFCTLHIQQNQGKSVHITIRAEPLHRAVERIVHGDLLPPQFPLGFG